MAEVDNRAVVQSNQTKRLIARGRLVSRRGIPAIVQPVPMPALKEEISGEGENSLVDLYDEDETHPDLDEL